MCDQSRNKKHEIHHIIPDPSLLTSQIIDNNVVLLLGALTAQPHQESLEVVRVVLEQFLQRQQHAFRSAHSLKFIHQKGSSFLDTLQVEHDNLKH